MSSAEFNELQVLRRELVEVMKKNEFEWESLVADMYSHKVHFIYEIIQNADDAEAQNISFKLSENCLRIEHNGKLKFEYKNVEAITNAGNSTKLDQVNKIGRFGVGFKSVFTVTKTPHIHSGEYHFRIIDLLIPEEVDSIDCQENTIIDLPLNNNDYNDKEIIEELILDLLKNIDKESLLFLHNIKRIEWKTDRDSGFYACSDIEHGQEVNICKNFNGEEEYSQYLVFKREINIKGKSLHLAIAYYREGGKFKQLPKPIYVYFPTKEKPGLNFIAHVPYKTAPNRETINFYDLENQKLTSELSLLIKESILFVKKMGLIDIDFLNVLPIQFQLHNIKDPFYEKIFEEVKNLFNNNNLLPTVDSQLASPHDSIFVEPKDLLDLLSKEDLNKLFAKSFVIDSDITDKAKTKDLYYYLLFSLKVGRINSKNYYEKLSKAFLLRKSDIWLIEFYKFAYKHRGEILLKRPIIRLEDGLHTCPRRAYLPSNKKTHFPTIKQSLVNEETIKFFKDYLDMKEPDDLDEIKEFIAPKYWDDNLQVSKEEYLEDFEFCYSLWEKNKEKQNDIIDQLKKINFLGCIDNQKQFCIRRSKPLSSESVGLSRPKSDNKNLC